MSKKKIGVSLVVCLIALPMFARSRRDHRVFASGEPTVLTAERIDTDVMIGPRLLRQARQAALRQAGPAASAIVDNRSARIVSIPAAGSVRGAGGTFFRSDVTLVNWNQPAQPLKVLWYPQGGSAPVVYQMTLPGDRPPITTTDFVGTVLKISGLGSLVFVPVDAAGQFDANGAIDAYSRIWTNQPNATGTVSQPFTSVDPSHLFGEYEAFILGLRQDASYRTNFGIVNFYDKPLPFVVTIFAESSPAGSPTEIHVTVPAQSMIQQSLPSTFFGTPGPINLAVNVDMDVPNNDQIWTAYASSTDNITGDGWASIATKDWGDEELDKRAK